MEIRGFEEISYGVEDMEACVRFCLDFGLELSERDERGAVFRSLDGSVVNLRHINDPDLPAPTEPGSTLREMVLGVFDQATLDLVAEELARDRVVIVADGRVKSCDNSGLGLVFQIARKPPFTPTLPVANVPGHFQRPVNTRIAFEQDIRPIGIAHVVLNCADEPAQRAFYTERLGYIVSDSFKGAGAFLRTPTAREHHSLFTVRREANGLNHVAFYVTDFHEVMLGGTGMQKKGWKSYWGPGRHKLGSNYFWYIKAPMGGNLEYTSDVDHVDENWVPGEFDFSPEMTAIWSDRDFAPA